MSKKVQTRLLKYGITGGLCLAIAVFYCVVRDFFQLELVEKYQPKVILSLHAPYKVVNYDGGKSYYEVVEKISKIMNYPVEPSIGYPTPGSFGTWAGIEKGILTITLELDEEIDVNELKVPVFKVFEYLEGIE